MQESGPVQNVIVFGECGVGKSSIINLVVGSQVAETSPGDDACTIRIQQYDVIINGEKYSLWDTAGLDGGSFGLFQAATAERHLKTFLRNRLKKDEPSLLIYCVRASKATQALVRHYRSVRSAIRDSPVPMAIVVTGIENSLEDLENWWEKNAVELSNHGMEFVDHACITSIDENSCDSIFARTRRAYSQHAVRKLILQNCTPREQCQNRIINLSRHPTPTEPRRIQPPAQQTNSSDMVIRMAQVRANFEHITNHFRHVVLIGEHGSGKSSVINLIAGHDYAMVSPDAAPCTTNFTSYDAWIEGRTYRMWDTPGLNEPSGFRSFGRSSSTGESIRKFLQERYRRGELDLLVFCVRGSRAHEGMSRAYKTFLGTTRQLGIPVVIAITHLERQQPTMEAWWQSNEGMLGNLGLIFDGHVCITCLSPHHRTRVSQQDIRDLISGEYHRRPRSALSDKEYLPESCVIC